MSEDEYDAAMERILDAFDEEVGGLDLDDAMSLAEMVRLAIIGAINAMRDDLRKAQMSAATCVHCQRRVIRDRDGAWVDPEATGDDRVWRETCDASDTFTAEHEVCEWPAPLPANRVTGNAEDFIPCGVGVGPLLPGGLHRQWQPITTA
jgi:hypothetical protein